MLSVDVSALGHVHTLNLSGCDQLTDVSALGHVHTLSLSYYDVLNSVGGAEFV
jgi:hypothetical protein